MWLRRHRRHRRRPTRLHEFESSGQIFAIQILASNRILVIDQVRRRCWSGPCQMVLPRRRAPLGRAPNWTPNCATPGAARFVDHPTPALPAPKSSTRCTGAPATDPPSGRLLFGRRTNDDDERPARARAHPPIRQSTQIGLYERAPRQTNTRTGGPLAKCIISGRCCGAVLFRQPRPRARPGPAGGARARLEAAWRLINLSRRIPAANLGARQTLAYMDKQEGAREVNSKSTHYVCVEPRAHPMDMDP